MIEFLLYDRCREQNVVHVRECQGVRQGSQNSVDHPLEPRRSIFNSKWHSDELVMAVQSDGFGLVSPLFWHGNLVVTRRQIDAREEAHSSKTVQQVVNQWMWVPIFLCLAIQGVIVHAESSLTRLLPHHEDRVRVFRSWIGDASRFFESCDSVPGVSSFRSRQFDLYFGHFRMTNFRNILCVAVTILVDALFEYLSLLRITPCLVWIFSFYTGCDSANPRLLTQIKWSRSLGKLGAQQRFCGGRGSPLQRVEHTLLNRWIANWNKK